MKKSLSIAVVVLFAAAANWCTSAYASEFVQDARSTLTDDSLRLDAREAQQTINAGICARLLQSGLKSDMDACIGELQMQWSFDEDESDSLSEEESAAKEVCVESGYLLSRMSDCEFGGFQLVSAIETDNRFKAMVALALMEQVCSYKTLCLQ